MRTVTGDGNALPHSFIDSLGEACLLLDEDMCVIAANASAAELYAMSRYELAGISIIELCADGHADSVIAEVAACNGSPRRFGAMQVCGDGSRFEADICAKRCSSEILGASLLLVRRAPAQKPCTDIDLRGPLLDNCIDAVLAYTLDGDLLYANEAALELWNMTSLADLQATGRWGWVPPEQRALVAHRIGLLEEHGEARYESEGTRGGEPSHCEVHARVVHTATGPVVASVVRDISKRMRADELVRYLAYHDSLTGLANRAMLDQELAHAISGASRHNDIVGLVFIDLDDFKPINDTMGHAIGDHALREVAQRITSCVRLTDTVARMGGDEFVVLLPRLRCREDLPEIARKIFEEVSRTMEIAEFRFEIVPSIGLAIHERGEDAEAFMIRADLAMYRSREACIPGWELIA